MVRRFSRGVLGVLTVQPIALAMRAPICPSPRSRGVLANGVLAVLAGGTRSTHRAAHRLGDARAHLPEPAKAHDADVVAGLDAVYHKRVVPAPGGSTQSTQCRRTEVARTVAA
jgi:hypothetical protein